MMFITKELTARMERCIKQTHIEVTRQYASGAILDVNGGAACFSGFDSFLSQVVGWGFRTKSRHFKTEIEIIEHFYKGLGHSRVDIELCPYVGNDLIGFLSERGYRVSEINNVSALDLSSFKSEGYWDSPYEMRVVSSDEVHHWARRVAMGFGYPEAQEQFTHYANAKGVTAFGVYDEGEIIAGATVAMHEDVCDLGVTSTLPAYRGKGLQKKLLMIRLNFARQHGLVMATVTTEPGTISDLNVQKSGFRCAYTRIKLTRDELA
ncbi:putative Acetyltransferase, GNAT family [Legionella moravica]|uniref:Acetyltransferase, GNAT family n=2 Tax=Legionella moravica TaxID=39962 RepID=A0A378JYD0_9GAMM|nr:putative Acetyltransferase, GNAT family [Legionella moravica]STX62418.1 putative Acetyltransferase, GNAT family [Legionella moravica]